MDIKVSFGEKRLSPHSRIRFYCFVKNNMGFNISLPKKYFNEMKNALNDRQVDIIYECDSNCILELIIIKSTFGKADYKETLKIGTGSNYPPIRIEAKDNFGYVETKGKIISKEIPIDFKIIYLEQNKNTCPVIWKGE